MARKQVLISDLSGEEIPNLGNWEAEAKWEPILAKYKGTELGDYLRMVVDKGVRTARKPQCPTCPLRTGCAAFPFDRS